MWDSSRRGHITSFCDDTELTEISNQQQEDETEG